MRLCNQCHRVAQESSVDARDSIYISGRRTRRKGQHHDRAAIDRHVDDLSRRARDFAQLAECGFDIGPRQLRLGHVTPHPPLNALVMG